MESWQIILPDYSIKCWNENSFDINRYEFTKKAYKLGKYAFVSDVCRLHALYEEGGIYLDTDMLVLKDFSPLLNVNFFIGEEREGLISAGIIGCEAKNEIIKGLLEGYSKLTFDLKMPLDIPRYLTTMLDRSRIKTYSKDYFYPLSFINRRENYKLFLTPDSFAVHLWNFSWRNEWSYLHDKDFSMAFKEYMQRIASSPKSIWKDTFPVDFIKYFLAAKFGSIYRMYKNWS